MEIFWIILIIIGVLFFGFLVWTMLVVGKRGDHSSEGEPRDEQIHKN